MTIVVMYIFLGVGRIRYKQSNLLPPTNVTGIQKILYLWGKEAMENKNSVLPRVN